MSSNEQKVMRTGGYQIKKERAYAGFIHWAIWFDNIVPRYQVVRYVGRDEAAKVLMFQSRDGKTTIFRGEHEMGDLLRAGRLKPFVLDIKRAETMFSDVFQEMELDEEDN